LKSLNSKAQVHILEVVIVAGILLVTLFFINGFDFTPKSVLVETDTLESRGLSLLSRLESIPDIEKQYSTQLARYIYDSIHGDNESFINYMKNSLPSDMIYSLSVVNISDMSKEAKSIDQSRIEIYNPPVEIGEKVFCPRVVVIDGFIYELELNIWFI